MDRIIEINQLKTYFYTMNGVVAAVDDVSLYVNRGETLCIVGESGCGKSVTSLSIMQLLPSPPAKYVQGEIIFEGENLLNKTEKEMCKIRGNKLAMIFQEPMTALNPVYTVGQQISETLRLHTGMNRNETMEKAHALLQLVGVTNPERRLKEYPHQLSGGIRQRVMIAIALSCNPKLLIADEPTTALDVTIQAQILCLMKKLKKELGMTIMLITHDLGVVAQMAERVIVMYSGKIMEEAPVKDFFKSPYHPYTKGLLECIPRIDRPKGKLCTIPGSVPNLKDMGPGCVFCNRCPQVQDICRNKMPELVENGIRRVACHFVANNLGV